LSGLGFDNDFNGFGSVIASATAGGNDTLDVHAIDYLFSQLGSWEDEL
jgi:hypothetical protein